MGDDAGNLHNSGQSPLGKTSKKLTLEDGLGAFKEFFYACDHCGMLILRDQAVSIPIDIGEWKALCISCAELEKLGFSKKSLTQDEKSREGLTIGEVLRRSQEGDAFEEWLGLRQKLLGLPVSVAERLERAEAVIALAKMLIQPGDRDNPPHLIGHRRFSEALMHGVRGFTFRPGTTVEFYHARLEESEQAISECHVYLDKMEIKHIGDNESLISRLSRFAAGAAGSRHRAELAEERRDELGSVISQCHNHLDESGQTCINPAENLISRLARIILGVKADRKCISDLRDRINKLEDPDGEDDS